MPPNDNTSHSHQTVAALYVQTGGAYYGLPDVDPWDEARDARLYAGPWPVVAHPPCNRWAKLAPKALRGLDAGCFQAALRSVRTYGGVLEHPASSYAWTAFDLPRPSRQGWASQLDGIGWACEVDQHAYGFPTRKRTWLYYVGPPPSGEIREAPDAGRGCDALHSSGRSRTPPAFRDALLALARSTRLAPPNTGNPPSSLWASAGASGESKGL